MADEIVERLLSEWGFGSYITAFRDQEIDEEALLCLNDSLVTSLLPTVGARAKFLGKLQLMKAAKGLTVSQSTNQPGPLATDDKAIGMYPIPTKLSTVDIQEDNVLPRMCTVTSSMTSNIRALLNSHPDGKMIMAIYARDGLLTSSARRQLVDLTVNKLIQDYTEVLNFHMNDAAIAIAEIFPGEHAESYYVAPMSEGPGQKISKGKLPDKYCNRRKSLKAAGVLVAHKRQLINEEESRISYDDIYEANKNWLKHSSESWPKVLELWKSTSAIRLQEIRNSCGKISEIFQEWPRLKDPNSLIEKDFDSMYPGKENALFEKWSTLASRVIRQINRNVKDKYVLEQTKMLLVDGEMNKDLLEVVALYFLPCLLPAPVIRCQSEVDDNGIKRKRKTNWKPTNVEMMQAFIILVPVPRQPSLPQSRHKLPQPPNYLLRLH